MISVLIPERGRPAMLQRLLASLLRHGAYSDFEILIAVDDDDPAWPPGSLPENGLACRWFLWPRPITLGVKLNMLAERARGDVLLFLGNDMVMETQDWPSKVQAAADALPNGIGVPFLNSTLSPGMPTYPIITRKMMEAVGWFMDPKWPFWFLDTAYQDIGLMIGALFPIDVTVSAPDGLGKTHGMIDLPFWVRYFEATRPERITIASRLLNGSAVPQDRIAECRRRTAHLSSPDFLARWGATGESPPGPRYAEAKANAQKVLDAMPKPTICLCMIVKDEAPVLQRLFDSVRPIIDTWCIVDTGSTDGTQQIIAALASQAPGYFIERPWVDFATNRSEALAFARPLADYTLIMDADDPMEIAPGFVMPDLTADHYSIDIENVGTRYRRTQIVKNAIPWRYRGVLHEFLEGEGSGPAEYLPGLTIRCDNDGARRHDPETYVKDALILARAVGVETDPLMKMRYTFYLAQSQRDAGHTAAAANNYRHRAEMGGWEEEAWRAKLEEGRCYRGLERWSDFIRCALAAYQMRPSRAEPLYDLTRYYRERGEWVVAALFCERGMSIPYPAEDVLFVERHPYSVGFAEEYSIIGYYLDPARREIGHKACKRLAETEGVPEATRDLARSNLVYYERLAA